MRNKRKFTCAEALLVGSLFVTSAASAAIYTLPNFTALADGGGGAFAGTSQHFDFQPDEGWTGSPPNEINGEESFYLTTTVSWTAFTKADPLLATSNIGVIRVRMNALDNGGAARPGFESKTGGNPGNASYGGTNADGFGIYPLAYNQTDPDGAGPATAAPTVGAVNKSTTTSITFVMRMNQTATVLPSAAWFTDTSQQSDANLFLWMNPDLAATEASQPTSIAYNAGVGVYQGLTLQYNTFQSDITFSNIAIYTGDDTPFMIPEPSAALLGGLGMLALLRRRRH